MCLALTDAQVPISLASLAKTLVSVKYPIVPAVVCINGLTVTVA